MSQAGTRLSEAGGVNARQADPLKSPEFYQVTALLITLTSYAFLLD